MSVVYQIRRKNGMKVSMKSFTSLSSWVARNTLWLRMKFPKANYSAPSSNNIYHCCIHKSGSQWFKMFFNDPAIKKYTGLELYYPGENFIPRDAQLLKKLRHIPHGVIVSPLYIRYDDFKEMPKPEGYKAFYVMRDPRDLVISDYFSLKHSHSTNHPYIKQIREKLNAMSESDGIMERIENSSESYFEVLHGWTQSIENDKIHIFRFEDLLGVNQKNTFRILFNHCGIDMSHSILDALLNRYSFKNITGREVGTENVYHHYRKGVAGDWKKYFSEDHKTAFKKYAGQLLIKLGYELDFNW